MEITHTMVIVLPRDSPVQDVQNIEAIQPKELRSPFVILHIIVIERTLEERMV
jgi:hypothetical protein